jgi:hypothetical protein
LSILKSVFDHTLNSVIFGITLMLALAVYIAVGSGLPEVREYFEMNELQFFAAWPLKALMVLLVVNLIVVTWTRIPLTPPRYGVWCIHLGIITLIVGMGGYYWNKVEGQVKIPVGKKVDHFYDNFERALYVKHNGEWVDQIPLENLPRFKDYGVEHRNVERLNRPGLRGIQPGIFLKDADSGESRHVPFAEAYNWSKPLTIDIVGYWPYAVVPANFATDANSTDVGLRLAYTEPDSGQEREHWLMSVDQRHKFRTIADGAVEVEHRHLPDASIADGLKTAATQLFALTFTAGDKKGETFVEIGNSYTLGETGYSVTFESFNPAWPMFGTGEIVKTMTLLVSSPTMKYRRMILAGKPLQTDFKLDDPTGGPMGKRQTEPLDKVLSLGFTLSDPFHLMPAEAPVKHTLVTTTGGKLIDLAVAPDKAPKITEFADGRGSFTFVLDHSGGAGAMRGPFQPPVDPNHGGGELLSDSSEKLHIHDLNVSVARVDNIVKQDSVLPVPSAQRDRGVGQQGLLQAVRVRVKMGDWSKEVIVPFTPEAGERPQWDAPIVKLPEGDGNHTIQLALCNSRMRLPATIKLQNFELIPYPGGDVNQRNALIRDFRSTLVIEDPRTQVQTTGVAHMNNPVYYDGGRWLFFQAAYDGEGRQWTVLGIGNRPGVYVMTTGCVMIFTGLMYAFYLKPIVIRRMKQNAIAAARARAPRREEEPAEMALS